MSSQIQITGETKVKSLTGVLVGTSGVVSSLNIDGSLGIPQLDVNGKIIVSQLPNSVMEYKGTWDASTNTPTLVNGTGNQGDVYLCNVAGTVNFGAGAIAFFVGDQVIYSGSIWQRASGATGTVTSVAVTETGDSLNITGSPITTSGTINIGFNGTNLQYVNGAGNLTTFPILTGYVTAVSGTAPVVSSGGTTPAISMAAATGSVDGYLSATDFAIFSAKQSALTFSSPLVNTSGTISIPAATTSVNGYLASADFTTFNNKQNAITLTTTGTSGASTLVGATLNIPNYGSALTGYVPYTGATQDVDLGAFSLNGKSLHIKGTAGNGHLGLKHQSVAATGSANESLIYADSLGDLSWQNANLYLSKFITSANTANRSYTFPNANGTVALTSDISYPVTSVFGRTGAVVATNGDYTTAQVTEVTNLYFTDSRARLALSFVAGSGAYNNTTGVITIPTNNNQITNGAGYTTNVGTVTSVAATGGTGISITGSPITTSGTITITNTAPDQTVALTASTGISVTGTYPNFTITNTSPSSGGTVTSVAALTIGTSGTDLSSTVANSTTTPVITLNVPTASAANRGALSSADWTTFNNKQSALTNPVTGTGTTNYLPKFTGTSTIGNSLVYDDGTSVGVGTIVPLQKFDVTTTAGEVISSTSNRSTNGQYISGIVSSAKNSSAAYLSYAATYGLIESNTAGSESGAYTIWTRKSGTLSEKLRLDASGNLGLGVTPSASGTNTRALQLTNYGTLSGNGNIGSMSMAANAYESADNSWNRVNGTSAGLYQISYTGQHSWYYTGSASANSAITWTQAMLLNASGNLGLGVTPSAWNSIFTAIEIGRLGDAIFSGSGGGTIVSANAYFGASNWVYARTAAATNYDLGSGQHRWYIAPSGTAGNAITFTQAMTLTAAGRLLLGTTTESTYLLDVNGTGRFVKSSDQIVKIETTSGTDNARLDFITPSKSYTIQNLQTGAANALIFYDLSASAERMRIASGGELLIANSSGTHVTGYGTNRLVVNGGIYATSSIAAVVAADIDMLAFVNTGATYSKACVVASMTATGGTGSYFFYGQQSTSTAAIKIFSNGNIQNTNNSYGAISDARLKENIKDATPKLDDLMKVKVRNYNLKGESNKQLGVISQELEAIFPNMIEESTNMGENMKIKGVKYSVFVPMLIKAVQELKAEIEILKNK